MFDVKGYSIRNLRRKAFIQKEFRHFIYKTFHLSFIQDHLYSTLNRMAKQSKHKTKTKQIPLQINTHTVMNN